MIYTNKSIEIPMPHLVIISLSHQDPRASFDLIVPQGVFRKSTGASKKASHLVESNKKKPIPRLSENPNEFTKQGLFFHLADLFRKERFHI